MSWVIYDHRVNHVMAERLKIVYPTASQFDNLPRRRHLPNQHKNLIVELKILQINLRALQILHGALERREYRAYRGS